MISTMSIEPEVWTGGYWSTTEDKWMWSDNTPFSFYEWGYWGGAYPKPGSEMNVLLTDDRLLTRTSSLMKPFICKR